MNIRSTQPRRTRLALVGLTAAALSFVAVPGSVNAQYPPAPDSGQSPPAQVPTGEVSAGGGTVSGAALPATGGSGTTEIIWIASSALLAGVAISAVSLRRRNPSIAAD